MIRASLRSISLVCLPLLAAGCFEDVGSSERGDSTTGDGDGDGDGDPSGDGDGDPSGDGDGDPSGDGDGDPGPQVIDSVPAADAQDAGLEPYFLLYFDRVVDAGDALGNILVSQAGGPAQPVTVMPCPNLDPTCVAGLFPAQLLDDNRLPPDTEHEIVINPGFEDTNGNVTSVEQTLSYRTFAYDPLFFDDSNTLAQEVGGIAYDPGSTSLFIVGVSGLFPDGPTVRRINLVNGSPAGVNTAIQFLAVGGPATYGLDRYGNRLFMSLTQEGSIHAFSFEAPPVLQAKFSDPSLPAPHDTLSRVWSVARSQDGRMFASYGQLLGPLVATGIVEVSAVEENWSLFSSGANLWAAGSDVTIAVGQIGGAEYLIAYANGKLFKFRTSDAELVAEYETDLGSNEAVGLRIDSDGRLWIGGNTSGIRVYDVSGNQRIELARRAGIPCGRMALREGPGPTNAYCVSFRGAGVVSRIPISL